MSSRGFFAGSRRLVGWNRKEPARESPGPFAFGGPWDWLAVAAAVVFVGVGKLIDSPALFGVGVLMVIALRLQSLRTRPTADSVPVMAERHAVHMDQEGLTVDGELVAPRAAIRRTAAARRSDGHFVVRVFGRWGLHAEIVADSPEEAIQAARVLRPDEGAVYALRWRGSVVIGSDGVLVRNGTSRELIRMQDIVGHSAHGDALVLETVRGKRTFRLGGERGASDFAALELRDHRDAFRQTHAFAEGLGKDGDRRSWVARLAGERDGYRERASHDDMLWRIVETPAAAPGARAAAALLLRKDSVWATHRLRVAAQACASPKLRVALDGAAEGDEAAVDGALAELEAEQVRSKTA